MKDMTNQIGFLAIDICNMLKDSGEVSVLRIRSGLNVSNTLVFLAIGWLSREGRVHIRKEGDDYLVWLVEL